ncbi:MAG: hypothetical protein LBD14_05335 [Puniceicoccales bacterium]|jgi:tetratricopeptide (TPR) repeat protein|nr:hypothetical protein [Puniceicoccales bacterium]
MPPSATHPATRLILALALATTQVALATDTPPRAVPGTADLKTEADAQVLEKLLRDQHALLDALQNDPETMRLPQAEKERRVLDIMRRHKALLAQRPGDPLIMVAYARFLRLVDARAEANHWFEKADALLPDTPVIKHQLGAHAAEEGDYRRALDLLETAVRLDPQTALYHFHLGEFLATYQRHLVRDALLKRAECDAKMQAAFARATALAPAENRYRWRHAESFFECEKPDWKQALGVWETLRAQAATAAMREAATLRHARILIELGRLREAQNDLDTSKSPGFEAARAALREQLKQKGPPTPSS